MNALRSTSAMIARLKAYNADLARERAAAMADALVTTADAGADGPASVNRAREPYDVEGRSRGTPAKGTVIRATRIVCESHVDTLHAQGHLSAMHWSAGTWFRRRYLLGYRSAVVVAGYGERTGGAQSTDETERVTDARHDLAQIAKLLSMQQWAAVETAAGHDLALGDGRLRFLESGLELVALYRDTVRKR